MTPRATSAASLVEALRLIAIEPGGNPKGGIWSAGDARASHRATR